MVDNVRDYAIFTARPRRPRRHLERGGRAAPGLPRPRDPSAGTSPCSSRPRTSGRGHTSGSWRPPCGTAGPTTSAGTSARTARGSGPPGVLTAVRDDAGRLRGFIKVMRDITERRLAEDERAELLDRERGLGPRLEALSRAKDQLPRRPQPRAPHAADAGAHGGLGPGGRPGDAAKGCGATWR